MFKATVGVDIRSPDPGTAKFTVSDGESTLAAVAASNAVNRTIKIDLKSVDRLTLTAERITIKNFPTFFMVFGDPKIYCSSRP